MNYFTKRASALMLPVIVGLSFLFSFVAKANNLSLGALTFTSPNVTFTVSWDNSWYANSAPNNWDAVWLFVKYKDCSTTNWLHAPLTAVPADHTVADAVNYQLETVGDNKGIFIRRAIAGSSGTSSTTVTLKLNIPAGTYNFKVFGIEMVKVLNENFDLGDGAATGRFNSINIASEAALTAAVLGGTGTAAGGLPAAYPKGWNAFYSMKYEITQQQYVDFLNTLTYTQQASRTAVAPNVAATNWVMGPNAGATGRSRNGIKMKISGVASTTPAVYGCDLSNNGTAAGGLYDDGSDGENLPCNYLGYPDVNAYLDWACLRPMSDLEFEKICRGPIGRMGGEYAWGSTTVLQATAQHSNTPGCGGCGSALNFRNAATETSTSSGTGLCAYGYVTDACSGLASCDIVNYNGCSQGPGPIRSGFAATATTNRVQSGASYYGAMDMSGNVAECVIGTNATGALFTGTLGDGDLSTTNADWPPIATAVGTFRRGGSWSEVVAYLQTSDRSLQATADLNRLCTSGGRGVR